MTTDPEPQHDGLDLEAARQAFEASADFTIGTEDPLLDDSLFMEARWRAAGHPTELRIWPEAPHGFVSFPMSVADVALAAEHDFLRRTLRLDI